MRHNGYLQWKDGRREPTDVAGGMKIIMPRRGIDGRMVQVTFEAALVADDGLPIYVEGGTEDVNARYREAEARHMVEAAIRRGVALPGFVLKARYRGETNDEFARRVEILRPVVEGTRLRL